MNETVCVSPINYILGGLEIIESECTPLECGNVDLNINWRALDNVYTKLQRQ